MAGNYDYSDSDEEQTPGADPLDVIDREREDKVDEKVPAEAKPVVAPTAPSSAPHPNPSIRIKIKAPKSSSTPSTAQDAIPAEALPQRSSLSPPPPLTLKFGLPASTPTSSRSVKAEKAAYSSSEDDDEYGPSGSKPKRPVKVRKPPTPKASKKRPQESQSNPLLAPELHSSGHPAGRKSYDWLIPSVAGASHRGPEGRSSSGEVEHDDADMPSQGSTLPGELKEKRSHKRRREGEIAGPGKNWRKGIKKGMARAKESGIETPLASTPGNSRPGSPEGTPEEDEARVNPPRSDVTPVPVPDDGPFVLADPVALGFPVFQKPIAPPKMILSNFPKVTPYFLPNNGGDTGAFPRREKTRSWKSSERTFVGIGGGTLKFKSWTRGPASELTQILKAEKDLNEVKAKASKDGSNVKSSTTKDKDVSDAKPKQQRIVTLAPKSTWPDSATPSVLLPVPSVPEPAPSGSRFIPPLTGTVIPQPPPITSHPLIEPGKPIPSVLQPYDPTERWDPASQQGFAALHAVHPPPPPGVPISTAPPRKKPRPSKPRPKAARPSLPKSPSSDSITSMPGDLDSNELASKGPRKSKLAQEIHPDAEAGTTVDE